MKKPATWWGAVCILAVALAACGGDDAGPPDTGVDAGYDAGPPDTGVDASYDAGPPDTGVDAGYDAGPPDAGVDASYDAGPECDVDGDGYDSPACGGDDCRDHNADVHPGQTQYFSDGYCTLYDFIRRVCLLYSWDYDCDGEETPQPASDGCSLLGGYQCVGSGPIYAGDPPACGTDVDYRSCALRLMDGLYTCSGNTEIRGMPCR